MKTTRKALSVLLALTLLIALGATALAAGTGQINVVDPGTEYYRAYKVFDAEVDPVDTNKVIYTIKSDSRWLPVVFNTSTKASEIAGLSFTPDADPAAKYTVTMLPGFNAAGFADTLKSNIPSSAVVSAFNGATNNVNSTDSDLDPGYYLVVSSTDASFDATHTQTKAMLTTVLNKPVNIQNKNDMPFEKTVDGEKTEGVKIGQVLDFVITSKVPNDIDTASDTYYGFFISDTMDEGLTFDKTTLSVTIDGAAVTLTETDVADAVLSGDRVRFGKNDKTFEISLEILERVKATPALKGKEIIISYQATVNDQAAATVSENNAVLTYGNDPNNLIVKDTQTKVYDSRIVIDKFENGAPEQKLRDAEFVLMKYTTTDADGTGVDKTTTGVNKYYYKATYKIYSAAEITTLTLNTDYINESGIYYAIDANGKKIVTNVEWVNEANVDQATKGITDVNGAAIFAGLKDGVYYLVETKAPAGYTALAEPIKIEVNGSHSITPGMSDEQITAILTNYANVANTPGTALPSTGGIGTTIFYLVGSVLMIGAAAVLVLRKRKDAEA